MSEYIVIMDESDEVRAPSHLDAAELDARIIEECLSDVARTPLLAKSVRESHCDQRHTLYASEKRRAPKRERWAPAGLKHRHVTWKDYREMCRNVERHFARPSKYSLFLRVRDLSARDQQDYTLLWRPADRISAVVILQELHVREVESRGELIELLQTQPATLDFRCDAVFLQDVEPGTVERLSQHTMMSLCYVQICEVAVPMSNRKK